MKMKITVTLEERVEDDDTNPIDKYGREKWEALAKLLLKEAEDEIHKVASKLGMEAPSVTWWHTKDGMTFASTLEK